MVKKEKIRTKLREKLGRPKRKDIIKSQDRGRPKPKNGERKARKADKNRCKKLLDETVLYPGDIDVSDAYEIVMNMLGRK